jgi:hypothetical protein
VLPTAVAAALPLRPEPATSLHVCFEVAAVAVLVALLLLSGLYAGFLSLSQEV